jgi:predicted metal-dependent hydrolase
VQVRQPSFDFAGVDPVWADDPVAVHGINAQGLVPAYIEPFLIKVMRRAKAELDPVADAELLADIDVFNKQEAQHFKFHVALNRWIRDGGYPGMADHERRYEAEYDEMLADRPLPWLVAYCEGFESMGLASARGWVDGTQAARLTGADPRPIALWEWHLAEEYEHRTVVFRLLKRLYGRNPLRFYGLRLSGLFHAATHIGRNVSALQAYLLRTYREEVGGGTPPSPSPSRGAKLSQLSQLRGFLPVLSPFYDPARASVPTRLKDVLGQ